MTLADTARWRLREAGPDDADALALVGAATFLESYARLVEGEAIIEHCRQQHSPAAYRALFEAGAQAWLGTIEPGDAPIGFALACAPDLDLARAGDWELRRIYALSRFQGEALGHALLGAVLAAAGRQGHRRLVLGVKEDNHRAIAFYRRQGFEQIGTRRFCVGCRTFDDLVLARPVRAQQGMPA